MLEPDYAFIRRSQMTVIELRKLVRTLYQDDNFFSTAIIFEAAEKVPVTVSKLISKA